VLDEPHHVEQGTSWHRALAPLFDRAVLVVLMTGTLERGDGGRIAFIDYREQGGKERPILESLPDCAVVPYARADALAEDDPAIVPIEFMHLDLAAGWVDRNGDRISIDTFDAVARKDSSDAIFTGLETRYARDLLNRCVSDWRAHRDYRPPAQLLVVAHSQARARDYDAALRAHGVHGAGDFDDGDDAASDTYSGSGNAMRW
jgi:hypothetical protein